MQVDAVGARARHSGGCACCRHPMPFEAVDAARSAGSPARLPAKKLDTRDWVTPQWRVFPRRYARPAAQGAARATSIRRSASRAARNAEMARSWFMLVIRNAYQPGLRAARGVPADDRPPQADRAAVRGADEDAGRARRWRSAYLRWRAPAITRRLPRPSMPIVNPAAEDAR